MCVSECNLRKRACVSVIVRTRSTNSIGESEKARARKRESEKRESEKVKREKERRRKKEKLVWPANIEPYPARGWRGILVGGMTRKSGVFTL
jgi:hypothetical protein